MARPRVVSLCPSITETYYPRDVPETADHVRALGEVLGRADAGRDLGDSIDAERERIRAKAPRNRPTYAYLIWRKPWMAAGGGTFIEAVLGDGGLHNAFADRDRYPEVTAGEISEAEPAVVLLSSEPFPFHEAHRAELSDATGLPAERFRFVDGQLLSWHGVRTIAGLRYASELARAIAD